MRVLASPSRRIHAGLGAVAVAAALVLAAAPGAVAQTGPAAPAPGAPAPAPDGTAAAPDQAATATFGIGAANAERIDGRPDLTFLASPGAKATDRVGIVNLSLSPLTLDVYVSEASNSGDGTLAFAPRDAAPVDSGRWLTLGTPSGTSTVTVAPRSTMIVPVSVAVPPDAEPGDHAAALVVSLTATGAGTDDRAQRLSLEQRVATKVFFRISGELRPQLTVEQLQADYRGELNPLTPGSVGVTYRVRNTGNVRLTGAQRVTVRGLLGDAQVDGPPVPLLLPGGTFETTVQLPRVWPQLRMSATATVTPMSSAGDVNPSLRPVSAVTHFWAVPLSLFLLLLLLALLGAAAIFRRRRPRLRRRRGHRGRDGDSGPLTELSGIGGLDRDALVRERRASPKEVRA